MNNKQKITRAIWLAFQASSPMGMGFLHAATADKLRESDMERLINEDGNGGYRAYTDYVAGRMMKTQFVVNADGCLSITPEIPRHDYQSWAGRYRSATEIVEDVETSPVPTP